MENKKFKISIIDFMPHFKTIEVGKYEDGSPAYIGDCVRYNDLDNWFIAYRYGKIVLKQVGMMAMISLIDFEKGDFSRVDKTNIFGAGQDWLAIGYTDESMYERLKPYIAIED